ncbi:MAG: hypothetical protein ACR2IK_20130 [Chloroflexota bacterium]
MLFAGTSIGGATLTRFYATHVFMICAGREPEASSGHLCVNFHHDNRLG